MIGGDSDLEGRVEVCSAGVWGTVCDNSWSSVDASVVCGQLGYPHQRMLVVLINQILDHSNYITDAIARPLAFFGQGSGDILLDNVGCTGTEDRLIDCSNNGIGVHNCTHSEDAGVTCQSVVTTPPRMSIQ